MASVHPPRPSLTHRLTVPWVAGQQAAIRSSPLVGLVSGRHQQGQWGLEGREARCFLQLLLPGLLWVGCVCSLKTMAPGGPPHTALALSPDTSSFLSGEGGAPRNALCLVICL